MKSPRVKIAAAAFALAAVFGGGFALSHGGPAQAAAPQAEAPAVAVAPMALPDMSAIVARYGQAVVNISISGTRKTAGGVPGLSPDDPFYEFFRRFGMPGAPSETPVRGLGSGFIVSPDGLVLTNAHVVEEADEVTVKLTDKREFKAKVLGLDKASDVAVLKIAGHDLPAVRIGKAAATRVGDWVLAIGSPFGFENSASAGIVSAKSRTLPDGSYVPFIQTDVAVNPGNSGGPLFNMAGEVVGINSQIYTRSGGYQGISFAIPIELAMNVEQQIVATGKVEHGKIGVSIQEMDQALAESFGFSKGGGALVNSVEKNGPAARAGVQAGDVILAINGAPVNSPGELPAAVASMKPGDSLRLKVWRQGAERDVAVTVGSRSEAKVAHEETPSAAKGRLGVAVRPLTPAERQAHGGVGGLLVVEASGAAARAGIQPGDVILSFNGVALTQAEELRALVAKSGKRAALLIERGDERQFVAVDLG